MRYYESPEEKMRRLENELDDARHIILNKLSLDLKSVLLSYRECESREEAYGWENTVAEKLVDHVEIVPCDTWQSSERAYCPLCRSGARDYYEEKGFTIPEGLRRHITGYGNTNKCSVMKQITSMAREYWNEELAKQERFEKEKAKVLLEAQGEGKPLCLVEPDAIPRPIDKNSYSWNPCRDKIQITWAEDRLRELGVEKKVDGRIISYIYDDGEIRIYANPFEQKKIEFRAYKLPLKSKSNKCCCNYTLPDYYKNRLKEKFEKFVLEAKNAED